MLTVVYLNGSHAKYPIWGTKLGCGEPRNVACPKVQRLSECLFKPSSTFQRDEIVNRAILVESFAMPVLPFLLQQSHFGGSLNLFNAPEIGIVAASLTKAQTTSKCSTIDC
jgi:hypothetical protein